jgi:transcriptional regulator with PAS, ATPase and Fis domain
MKELNEKFKKILEASGDLICFVDENRKISYMNPAYVQYLPVSSKNALGRDLLDISPNGLRMKVFNSRNKIESVIYQKESIDMVSTVEPLFIDDKFKGVISISRPAIQIKNLIRKLEESEEKLKYFRDELIKQTRISGSFKDIIGFSGSLRDCLIIAEKASHSTSTVLVRGESGTGKELVAKAIHNNSGRKNMPFIRVNCAAIPENLLESELFMNVRYEAYHLGSK